MYGIHFEKEIYVAAIATIEAHGEGARSVAARRATEFDLAGDDLANWQWHQITEAILEIERPWRHEDEPVH